MGTYQNGTRANLTEFPMAKAEINWAKTKKKQQRLIFVEGYTKLCVASGASLGVSNVAEEIEAKIRNYQTALLTATSPARTRPGTVGRATWTSPTVKGSDCWRGWCLHVQTVPACAQVPLPHILGVGLGWPLGRGMFPGKIWTGCTPPVLCLPSLS